MAMELQKAYCKKHNTPFFAPPDGYCFSCKHPIKDTEQEYITGCKHCHHSFCE